MTHEELRSLLSEEFKNRQQTNRAYSLRAFARFLQMDASTLSKIMKGKRRASYNNLKQICERLGLSDETKEKIWLSISTDIQSRRMISDHFQSHSSSPVDIKGRWYHFALLELLRCRPDFDIPTLAEYLKLQTDTVRKAAQDLEMLGLAKQKDGRIEAEAAPYRYLDRGFSSESLKETQKELLMKASEALDQVPSDQQCQIGISLSVNPQMLPNLKDKIHRFIRKLNRYVEAETDSKDQVYVLNMAFFPVSRPLKNDKELSPLRSSERNFEFPKETV